MQLKIGKNCCVFSFFRKVVNVEKKVKRLILNLFKNYLKLESYFESFLKLFKVIYKDNSFE